ncbi:type VI secretion system protein TssL, long form [Paraburkholderia sp.]|uniref:type VI secretion system protein TssL, long form n=1 Tax=Paraburkholderia sp. TaxID=1926495 RepID=UPI00238E1935|nr:type VI secretion system protein TssL, long form [Paraburkholderia sp.]MDE1183222.1 type VI secretion system protein TssL, long form [Paraburkholderia sp.]
MTLAPSPQPATVNALVIAAQPLLDMLAQIRLGLQAAPARMREYLIDEIRRFQTRAQHAAIPVETIVGARYCLCTALDEAAALTPWGGGGAWSAHSLLVAFHKETWGGEKFFQLLARLSARPREHRHLIELQYYCLALGFQGRYRVMQNGTAQLDTLTRRLHALLHGIGNGYPRALSPHWQAADRTHALPVRLRLTAWAWLPGAGLIGCVSFIGFLLASNNAADRTANAINAIRLPDIAVRNPLPPASDLARRLDADIADDALSVHDDNGRSVISIRGDGLFASGSAVANNALVPMLSRVAQALERIDGSVVVTGHTDDQPIHTPLFASNLALSEARAATVRRQLLSSGLSRAERVTIAGRGDQQPVDTNTTAEGRAHNRRVEIVVLPPPGSDERHAEPDSR